MTERLFRFSLPGVPLDEVEDGLYVETLFPVGDARGAMIITGTLSIHQAQVVSDEVWHLVDRAGAWMRT